MTEPLTTESAAPSRGSGTSRPTGAAGPSGTAGASGRPGGARSWRPWRTSALPAWWPPVLGILLGLTGGAGYGLLATPQYTATSYVVVVPDEYADSSAALGFAQAYGRIATDIAVLIQARETTGMTVDELRDSVRSATSPDAPVVEITGTAPRPERAAVVANAVADALIESGDHAFDSTGVSLSVFSPAYDPTEPTSPSAPLAAAVGASAGGLVGGLFLLATPRGRRDAAFPGVPAPASRTDRTEPTSRPAAADKARGDRR